jgi:hypothetical protein
LTIAGEKHDCFAEGLARNGAGVHADTTETLSSVDDCNFFLQLGGVDSALLRGRTRAEHN